MKVAIVNFGLGNLGSVYRALEDLGAATTVVDHPAALSQCDRIVLPGVGAFGEGMARLHATGFVDAIQRLVAEESRPLLGICLGMQVPAEQGEEGGATSGLGLIAGRVRRLDKLGCSLRIPHVGWNDIQFEAVDPLFAQIPQRSDFYFVHSFAFDLDTTSAVSARTDYGVPVVAAARQRHVFGTQFHPEKSSKVGRRLLQNFLDYRPC